MTPLWFERELETLLSLVNSLDVRLHEVIRKSLDAGDADEFGYFDVVEHITGLAFVAYQTYIATVCGGIGVDKGDAIKKGLNTLAASARRKSSTMRQTTGNTITNGR